MSFLNNLEPEYKIHHYDLISVTYNPVDPRWDVNPSNDSHGSKLGIVMVLQEGHITRRSYQDLQLISSSPFDLIMQD